MPPLTKQIIPMLFQGLDTKSDPRTAPFGSLDLVENLYQVKRNRWQMRNGMTALTRNIVGGGTISTGRRLATFNDHLLQATDTQLYEYEPTLAGWAAKGQASQVGVSSEPVSVTQVSQTLADAAVGGGMLCVVYASNAAEMHVTVIELATGAHLLTDTLVSSMGSVNGAGWSCRVVALTTCFMLFSCDGPTNKVLAAKIAYATPTTITSPGTSVATDLNATARFDVIQQGSNDAALVVYNKTVSGGKGLIWNSNMTAGNNGTFADTPDQCLSWMNWSQGDGNAYCVYVSSTGGVGLKRVTFNTTSMVTSGVTAMDATVVAARNVTGYTADAANFVAFAEVTASPTYNSIIKRSTGGGVANWQRSAALASKVIKQGTGYYLLAAYDSGTGVTALQNSYFLLDATTVPTAGANVVAKAFYGLGGGLTKSVCALPAGALISSGVWGIPVLKVLATNGAGTATLFASWLLKFDFNGTGLSPYKRIGENLHLSGGVVRTYDGDVTAELGFHLGPEKPTLAQAAGGSLTLLGTYQYIIVYSWYDSRGQYHQSVTSPAASITLTTTNNRVTLTIPTLRFGDRKLSTSGGNVNVVVEVYRTVANGNTFYLWDAGNGTVKFNDPTGDVISFNDDQADSSIQLNQKLYTTGGQQNHVPVPSAKFMTTFQSRLLLAGTEFPTDVWVSDEVQTGFGITFAAENKITIESDGGDITALGEMDDKAVAFKRSAIYILSGPGPTTKGAGNFSVFKLTSKVGATVPVVVKTPDGIMFKSAKGIYLLTRSLELQYLGANVETWNTLSVKDSLVVDDLNQVRFVTSDGRELVYDWFFKTWYTNTNKAFVSCDLWQNAPVYLASDGTVQQEIAGQYNDNGSAIVYQMRTTWLDFTQVRGYQRCYKIQPLIEVASSHTFQLKLAIDWDSTILQTAALAVTTSTPAPLEVRPTRQQFQALQATVTGTFGAAGQGMLFSGIAFEVGIKSGMKGLPSGQEMT